MSISFMCVETRPMGLTYAEAVRAGIGHLHPDHPGAAPPPAATPAAPARKLTLNVLGQNKTEARFDRLLEQLKRDGRILDFRWEPIKIRLAGRTWFKVDFIVQRNNLTLAAVEIKGFMRDDAAVKLKVAPEVFPFMDYYIAFADGPRWDVRRVGRSGIGPALPGGGVERMVAP